MAKNTGQLGTTYSQLSGIILGFFDTNNYSQGLAQTYLTNTVANKSGQAQVHIVVTNLAYFQAQSHIVYTYIQSGSSAAQIYSINNFNVASIQTHIIGTYSTGSNAQVLTVYRTEQGGYIWPKFGQAKVYILPIIRFEDNILNAQTLQCSSEIPN